jgi:hypothetical protein
MNKLDLIHFIIDKLLEQDKFYDYLLWFETIRDTNVTFNLMDNEYTIFTHMSILQYLQNNVTMDTYEFLDRVVYTNPDLNEFLTFCIDRKTNLLYIHNEFYELFINESYDLLNQPLK